MIQEIILKLSADDSKTLLSLLQEAKHLLSSATIPSTTVQNDKPETPLKREDILAELNLKDSTFYNLQRRGIITPHRMEGSRLTYYYRSEVLAALKKFNPGKYAR